MRLTTKEFYRWLWIIVWNLQTFVMLVFMVIHRMPIVSDFEDAIRAIFFIISALLAFRYISSRIRVFDILFYFFFVVVYMLSVAKSNFASDFLMEHGAILLLGYVPLYFVGVSYDFNDSKLLTYTYWSSCLSILIMIPFSFLYFAISANRGVDDMSLAYTVLPHYCFLVSHAFISRNKIDVIFSVIGFALLSMYGSRGPILFASAYLILEICVSVMTDKRLRRLIFIPTVLTFYFIVTKWETILNYIIDIFESYGLNVRIFQRLLSENFFESQGRSDFSYIIDRSLDNMPFAGYGMAGDRIFLGPDSYVHNIYYEILCSYGFYFGYIIFVFLLIMCIVSFVKSLRNTHSRLILFSLVFAGFLKLFLSNTYLKEPFFFILLGVIINLYRQRKIKKQNINRAPLNVNTRDMKIKKYIV